MKRLYFMAVIGLCTVLATAYAEAANIDLDWDAPTKRADGSELRANEIKQYNIYHAQSQDVVLLRSVEGSHHHVRIRDVPEGQNCFAASTVTTDNLEGDKSQVICVNVPSAGSKPEPVNIQITISFD